MEKIGWNWTKKEYPLIVVWIILILYLLIDSVFRNQFTKYEQTWTTYMGLFYFFIIVLLVISGFIFFRKKEIPADERTKKIKYKAKHHSWDVTYVLVIVLTVIAHLLQLTYIQLGLLIILSMIITQLIFVWYFSIKGDVV